MNGNQGFDISRMTIGVSENGEIWTSLGANAVSHHYVAQEHVINLGLSQPWRFIRVSFSDQGQIQWSDIQVFGQPAA